MMIVLLVRLLQSLHAAGAYLTDMPPSDEAKRPGRSPICQPALNPQASPFCRTTQTISADDHSGLYPGGERAQLAKR